MTKFFILFVLFFSINSIYGQTVNKQNTKMEDFSIDYDILIYPNPVINNNFYIKSKQIIKSIELMNVLGRNVKTIHNETGIAYNIHVELDNVDKGMYMLRLTFANKKIIIKRIVLQ